MDQPPFEFYFGNRLVLAEKAELLDQRRTVYRLKLKKPRFLTLFKPILGRFPSIKAHRPEWFLPATVILKQEKYCWEKEFRTEIDTYNILKPLQGITIPKFYDEAKYDGSPAPVLSEVGGPSLFELARTINTRRSEDEDKVLQGHIKDALYALWSYGVEYHDGKLDNLLVSNNGRVMIVDLEAVILDTKRAWKDSENCAAVEYVMEGFKAEVEKHLVT